MSANNKKAQGLERSLGFGTLLAIAVSSVSPTTSVFISFGSMLTTVGTGVALAFLVGGVIAVLNSLVYAELGTAFPISGGAYAIILRVFGKPLGLITAILYLLLGLGSVPSLAIGTASYLNTMFPGISTTIFVIAVIVLATLLAMARIHSASWVTAVMVILEFAIIIAVTILCFSHVIHPLSLGFTTRAVEARGIGGSLGIGVLFVALPITLFSFSGYELSQNFSEETTNVRRVLSRTIIISAVIGVVIETLAVLGLTLAAKNLGAATSATMPAYAIVQQALGGNIATILLIGVIIATLDCTIAVNMSYIRVFYNAARDGMFTRRLSEWLSNVSTSTRVPVRIAIVWGIMVLIISVVGSLSAVLAFTGVVLVLIYALVSVASFFARRKFPERMVFRMPLWPLPALLVLISLIYVLTQQTPRFLEITGGVIVVTALYYAIVLRNGWRTQRIADPEDVVDVLA